MPLGNSCYRYDTILITIKFSSLIQNGKIFTLKTVQPFINPVIDLQSLWSSELTSTCIHNINRMYTTDHMENFQQPPLLKFLTGYPRFGKNCHHNPFFHVMKIPMICFPKLHVLLECNYSYITHDPLQNITNNPEHCTASWSKVEQRYRNQKHQCVKSLWSELPTCTKDEHNTVG